MTHSRTWTTVTPLSKTIALILFILLPFIGFYLGMKYQKGIAPLPPDPEGIACTTDVKACSDGSYVGRSGPDCSFSPCRIETNDTFCGGIANIRCPQGRTCIIKDKYPDAGGTCQ